ncbi:hypothetical protein BGY98DRAFT_1003436, partial [Russula aff. rugulosa BPL654]
FGLNLRNISSLQTFSVITPSSSHYCSSLICTFRPVRGIPLCSRRKHSLEGVHISFCLCHTVCTTRISDR